MVKVKICGLTRLEDALSAIEYGADALGFVFYEKSPRFMSPEAAGEIVKKLPPFVTTVGVFVNDHPSRINEVVKTAGLDMVQLHGDEPQEMCDMWPRVIKAFRVRDSRDLERLKKYQVAAYLLDAYDPGIPGGTGQSFNWDIAVEAKQGGRVILAGGLTPDNVEKAVRRVRPYGVDVSSGVEKKKGIKDCDKMKLFIARAKSTVQPGGDF
ncbi:N-(5'-phosphoribosyl)anthranilate isomerase [bacterium BMS3Abin07]|nr:N-(5'-phosphoribosyl)anthranilate isomerase [bacterium BMS3Abin07]GBE33044.1 N-(5'-phosphoribosyl)anthranilate isomerase [bacterium BMS3Bbin05]